MIETISYTCPNCSAKLSTPVSSRGSKIPCPMCGGVLTVPATEPKVEEAASANPLPNIKIRPRGEVKGAASAPHSGNAASPAPVFIKKTAATSSESRQSFVKADSPAPSLSPAGIVAVPPSSGALHLRRKASGDASIPGTDLHGGVDREAISSLEPMQGSKRKGKGWLLAAVSGAILVAGIIGGIIVLSGDAPQDSVSNIPSGNISSGKVPGNGAGSHAAGESVPPSSSSPHTNALAKRLERARKDANAGDALSALTKALETFPQAPEALVEECREEIKKLENHVVSMEEARQFATAIEESVKSSMETQKEQLNLAILEAENAERANLETRYSEAWAAQRLAFPHPMSPSKATDAQAKQMVTARLDKLLESRYPVSQATLEAQAVAVYPEWKVGDIVSFSNRQGRKFEGKIFELSSHSVKVVVNAAIITIPSIDFSDDMKNHLGEGCRLARRKHVLVTKSENKESRERQAKLSGPAIAADVAREHNLIYRDGNFLTHVDVSQAIAKCRKEAVEEGLRLGRDSWLERSLTEKGYAELESGWVQGDWLPASQQLEKQIKMALSANASRDDVDGLRKVLEENRGRAMPIIQRGCDAYTNALEMVMMSERGFRLYGQNIYLTEDDCAAATTLDNALVAIQREVPREEDIKQVEKILKMCDGRGLPNIVSAMNVLAESIARLHTANVAKAWTVAKDEKYYEKAIELMENAIAANPQANNLSEAKNYLRELKAGFESNLRKLRQEEEEAREKAEGERLARENQKGMITCIEGYLNEQRVGNSGSTYFENPFLASKFQLLAVRSWEIVAYGWTHGNSGSARVRIDSSNRGGMPITVLWTFYMTYIPRRGWKISHLSE